ncbi:MAG: hypothetical protein HC897_19585, partial [Thermoanaerobaculia bacterium]|nr:hypothetical protein [Thermoanaerobaculia bacterium]
MLHRRSLLWAAVAVMALGLTAGALGAEKPEKIKVLLVGARHDWKGFHEVIAGVLKKTDDFDLT